MCGIAGLLTPAAGAISIAGLMQRLNDIQFHRGPDEGDVYLRTRRGVGTSPAVDHRPVHRPAAALQRRRLGGGRLQRRDLQLPGTRARARGPRPRLPHPQRHRGDRPCLGVGARNACSASAACSPSACGTATARPSSWPATASGVKPLYYAMPRRRHAGVRLRAEGADAAPGPRPPHRPPRGRRILRAGYVAEPRTIFLGRKAASRARACASAAASRSRPQALLGRPLHPRQPPVGGPTPLPSSPSACASPCACA